MMSLNGLLISADNHRSNGNFVDELFALNSALINTISSSVRDFDSFTQAIEYYAEWKVSDRIDRLVELFESRMPGILDGTDKATVGNSNVHPTLVCLCWLIEQDDLGRHLINLTFSYLENNRMAPADERILNVVDAYTKGEVLEPVFLPRMKKFEKSHVLYAELMNVCVQKADPTKILETIKKDFKKRNTDVKYTEPAPLALGMGLAPAKWDFWKEGILAYARRHNDYQNK